MLYGLIFIINFNCWTVTSSLFLPKSSWYQPSILDNLICFFFISIVIPSSPSRNASAANFSCSYIPYKLHFICEYIYLLQDQIKVWKYIPGTVRYPTNSTRWNIPYKAQIHNTNSTQITQIYHTKLDKAMPKIHTPQHD